MWIEDWEVRVTGPLACLRIRAELCSAGELFRNLRIAPSTLQEVASELGLDV